MTLGRFAINDPLVWQVAISPADMRAVSMSVVAELSDPDYCNAEHGKRSTRNLGCTGPLCMKALRDWARDRARTKAAMAKTRTKHSSRSQDYIEADMHLDKIHKAYLESRASWLDGSLDPFHTILLLDHETGSWREVNWSFVPVTIYTYATSKGIAASRTTVAA